MSQRTTASAWVAGMLRVTGDDWHLLGVAAAGRGGLNTSNGEVFMRSNFSAFDKNSGAWRDVIGGKFEPCDFGHKQSRFNRPDLANDPGNHHLERRSFNRSHQARDLTPSEIATEARIWNRVRWKARLSRAGSAGLKAGAVAMLFEAPFAIAEGCLAVRLGLATKSEAACKGAVQVAIAGASGFVIGAVSFTVASLVTAPVAIAAGSVLVTLGAVSTTKRTISLVQGFRQPQILVAN